jgi:hypothetical protein
VIRLQDTRQIERGNLMDIPDVHGPRTEKTAWAVIQGIEATQMIRKGQVLGITRQNLHGQAWVFFALLV